MAFVSEPPKRGNRLRLRTTRRADPYRSFDGSGIGAEDKSRNYRFELSWREK